MSYQDEIRDVLESYRCELAAAGRSKGTIAVRMSHARRALESAGVRPKELERAHVIRWLGEGRWGPAARASARASIRSLVRFMVRSGVLEEDFTEEVEVVRIPRSVPAPAADPVVAEAIAAADETVALAIEIMAVAGLRRSECARVRSEDVEAVGAGWVIRVVGKGGHERVVPIPSLLARKIRRRRGWCFPGGAQGHISAGWLGKRVSRALPEGVTAHKLRHRYATRAYAASHDLRAVQELLGHASVATTQVYVAAGAEAARAAAAGAWKIAV